MKKHAKLLAALGGLVVALALALVVVMITPNHQDAPAGRRALPTPSTASPTPSPTVDSSAEAQRKLMEGRFIKAMRRERVFPNAEDYGLLDSGYKTVQLLQETGSWREATATWMEAGMSKKDAGILVTMSIIFLCPTEGYPGAIGAYE